VSRRSLAYWLWRVRFEWNFHVTRKIARKFNRAAQQRSAKRKAAA